MQWTDLSIRPTKRSDREKIKTNEENFINDVVAPVKDRFVLPGTDGGYRGEGSA